MGSGWQSGSGLSIMQRASKMVDTFRFVVPERLVPTWLRAELDSPFTAPYAIGEALAQRRVYVTLDNLNLRRNALGEYVGENSLHRFYHGHNGGSFTRADVDAAIQRLSNTLGFDVSGCKLTKVAFGANLTGLDVQATLAALTDYKGKRFLKYEKGKSITGAKRLLTELELTLYDKKRELSEKRQATLPSPTLRYEITSHKLSYLRRLKATTVADLATLAFFNSAEAELIARIEACGFAEQLDYKLLTGEEQEALALINNLEIFTAYAANRANKDKCTRRRKLANQARKKALLASPKIDLLARLQSSLTELA
jgi:hypothetical protein